MGKEELNENNLFPVTKRHLHDELTLEELFRLGVRPSRIQSILIDLMQAIVDKRNVNELLQQYENSRFTEPCPLPQREIIELEKTMYQSVPATFEGIELSPVAPLGTSSILTEVSQKVVLSGIRNVEVLADPTTLLALECARRRKGVTKGSSNQDFVIDLCTSARCIRGQVFSKESGFSPHFQVFAMVSAGISRQGDMGRKMLEHLSSFLNFLGKVEQGGSYFLDNIEVQISNINIMESLIKSMKLDRAELGRHSQDSTFDPFLSYGIDLPNSVSNPKELGDRAIRKYGIENHVKKLETISEQIDLIKKNYPKVTVVFDLARVAGIGYYNGPCFKIRANNNRGDSYPLADGGYSDWLTKLLSGKVAFFSSGFGLELLGKFYKSG